MSDKVIQFPSAQDDGAMTDDYHRQLLIGLHSRLQHALEHNQKVPDRIRIVLSIDDVFEIGRLIEREVGPEYFDDGMSEDVQD